MPMVAIKRPKMCRKALFSGIRLPAAAALRASGVPATNAVNSSANLPHQVVLEVMSYLEPREIVRARCVARAFMSDAPALINSLRCWKGQSFPTVTSMDLFPRMAEVHLNGDVKLVEHAAPGLARCGALRRLIITRLLPQQDPLPPETTAILCGLRLSRLDIQRVRIEVPAGLTVSAWRTLDTMVLREAGLSDKSLVNMFSPLVGKVLPLRSLDLSRNVFGDDEGMRVMSEALGAFPDLESLELTADRIYDAGARRILSVLLSGSCPHLRLLELSLNFLGNDSIDFLAEGLKRETHGLKSLERLGFGGRFMPGQGISYFESLGTSIAAGALAGLHFLHLQGDVSPAEVTPLLRELRSGLCPELSIIKVERSTRFFPNYNAEAVEETVQAMLELVTCSGFPALKEVHVLGMNLGKGLETGWAPEEGTTFYRVTNMSSFHRLAAEGSRRGVMVFV